MTMIADEETTEAGADAFVALLDRLSRQSVTPGKHFDAYTDIDWDAPENAIDKHDPRFALTGVDPLGATEWYRSQPQTVQSEIGLQMIADRMRTGLQFENVLKRGLLEFASTLPNGSPLFRYVYHEVIEEAQHALMFQEYVNRSGMKPVGIPRFLRPGMRVVALLGARFPSLFFVFVLGGEDPIDHQQRKVLRDRDGELHPLSERIMRIHVTEEARHLSFARHYLKQTVPSLGRFRRFVLAIGAPLILGIMGMLMMRPSFQLVRKYNVPRDVLKQAYTDNPQNVEDMRASIKKVRALLDDLGVITPWARPIWRAFRLI